MTSANRQVMLIAVDDDTKRSALCALFQSEFSLAEAKNIVEALKILEKQTVNVVIAQDKLPDAGGASLVAAMRQRDQLSRIPVVIVLSESTLEAQKQAIKAGAADFIAEPYDSAGARRRIRNVIGRAENEWRKLVQEAHDRELTTMQSHIEHDALTGLYNRETFYLKAAAVMQSHRDIKYQIIYLDINCFKIINDLFHAETGNLILKTAAYYFNAFSGPGGVCGRMEADHFVLCLPEDAISIDALIDGLDGTMESLGINHNITFFAGIYPVTSAFLPVDRMCDRANMALRKVKGQYTHRYAYYDAGMREQMLEEQMIVRDMELSLHEKHFKIYLQPVMDTAAGKIVSAEALVRWEHPVRGMISPGKFVPIFERNGFIVRLDRYVWEEVCAILARQQEILGRAVPISVNISRLNFYNPDLLGFLLGLTQKYRISPRMLKLEITERAYTDNSAELERIIAEFRRYGFLILMDDFGSGFSSLSMLKNLPVDILKIDIGFVREIGHSKRADAILKYIMGLSQDLDMSVTIEGVETAEQVKIIESMGCRTMQGFYFSKPMPSEEFLDKLGSQKEE